MDTMEMTYRRGLDRIIRMKGCNLIFRFRLLPPVMEQLSQSNDFNLPNEARDSLDSFLKMESKGQCGGAGIKCVFKEPHGNQNELTLRYEEGEGFVLNANWKLMFRLCCLKAMAVISMWGYYEEEDPRFLFRLDGYAAENEPLPPLTDMDIVEHETVQYKEKKCCFDNFHFSIG